MTASLTAAYAAVGPSARRRASCRAASASSAAGTTSVARPSVRASSARIVRGSDQQLERLGPADQPRQRPGRAGVRRQPDAGEREVERRGVGDDPEVAGERDRRAGAGGDAVHRGDHRLGHRGQRRRDRGEVLGHRRPHRLRAATTSRLSACSAKVLADAERATGAGQHDGPDVGVVGDAARARRAARPSSRRRARSASPGGPWSRWRRRRRPRTGLGRSCGLLVVASGRSRVSVDEPVASGSSRSAWASKYAAAASPGHGSGSSTRGSAGSVNRNFRHSWTSSLRTANARSGWSVPPAPSISSRASVEPRLVRPRERIEVPRLADQRRRVAVVSGVEPLGPHLVGGQQRVELVGAARADPVSRCRAGRTRGSRARCAAGGARTARRRRG